MLTGQLATLHPVNGQRRANERIEHGERRKLVMLSRVVARSAYCDKVCRIVVAAILARFDMVELRTLDRQTRFAVRTRKAVSMQYRATCRG